MGLPEGYTAAVFRAPLLPELAGRVDRLVAHKGEPWVSDIHDRLRGDQLDLFALALRGDDPVANVWIGSSDDCPELGNLGHVFTVPEHRRQGLAGYLLRAATTRFDELGGRWLQLHTGTAAARRLYEAVGFRVLLAGGMPPDGGDWLMLRGGGAEGVGDAYHGQSGRWVVERYRPNHYGALAVFLNAVAGTAKMPLLSIDTGMHVEEKLLLASQAQDRCEMSLAVLLDAANCRPHGLACRRGEDVNVYAPRAPEPQKDALREHLRDG